MATYFGKKLKDLDGSHKKTPIMTEHDERHDILKHYFFPKNTHSRHRHACQKNTMLT